MKRLITFLILCTALTAVAQMPPPPVPMVMTNMPARPANQTLKLAWTPGAPFTIIYLATNSQSNPKVIQAGEYTGSSVTLSNLPWCRLFFFDCSQASNGYESPLAFAGSFSGWGTAPTVMLQECTNLAAASWQNVYCLTNPPMPAGYFRVAIGKRKVALQ